VSRHLTVYVDGACKGNPGPAGVGVYILQGETPIRSVSKFIGSATNNIAEYSALITALHEASGLEASTLEVWTDSELMYKQLTGQYKIKDGKLKPLFDEARRLAAGFEDVQLNHIPREKNQDADRLATAAIKNERAPMVASVFRPVGGH
jgi:ribonuclease HI